MFYVLLRGLRLSRFMLVLAVAGSLLGCSRNADSPSKPEESPIAAVPVTHSNPASADAIAAMHRPFSEATVSLPPPGSIRPPQTTAAGKDVGAIYEQIAGVHGKGGLWETIRFITPAGKRISYTAVIKTDLGDIHLEFFPDKAPNHVRNFLALAKTGYYDGLAFDFLNNSKVDGQAWIYAVAGCPLGTFESGTNIGYWLEPEINDLTHDQGAVGAWRDAVPDEQGEIPLESAGCKFYINVNKAPWMDGNYTIFARVTQGLDVVRRIAQAPLAADEPGSTPEMGRPQQPVTIRSVVVDQKEQ